jgi:hypothetical protein
MSTLVESLKRLYPTSQVVRDRAEGMYTEGKLTQEEYEYIRG